MVSLRTESRQAQWTKKNIDPVHPLHTNITNLSGRKKCSWRPGCVCSSGQRRHHYRTSTLAGPRRPQAPVRLPDKTTIRAGKVSSHRPPRARRHSLHSPRPPRLHLHAAREGDGSNHAPHRCPRRVVAASRSVPLQLQRRQEAELLAAPAAAAAEARRSRSRWRSRPSTSRSSA